MKLIDSHCHLPTNLREAELTLERAKLEGVEKVVNVGTSLKDSEEAKLLNSIYKEALHTVGIYPQEERHFSIEILKEKLQNLINSQPRPIAIGECGIDIQENYDNTPLQRQVELFKMQIELAIYNKLPLIIHNRGGDEVILKILEVYRDRLVDRSLKAVVHCFSSEQEIAERFIKLGTYLSFTGMITYQTKSHLLEVIKMIPLDKIMLETDSPYLTPNPFRKEINEPKYVKIVAQKVAETINQPIEYVCQKTYENTICFFNLP